MGRTALLPPPEGRCTEDFFSPWKIQRLRSGLNPRTWVPKASTLPLDHRSRSGTGLLLLQSNSGYPQLCRLDNFWFLYMWVATSKFNSCQKCTCVFLKRSLSNEVSFLDAKYGMSKPDDWLFTDWHAPSYTACQFVTCVLTSTSYLRQTQPRVRFVFHIHNISFFYKSA